MDSRNDSRTSHNRQDSVNDTVNSMTLRARFCDELDKEASCLEFMFQERHCQFACWGCMSRRRGLTRFPV